ncbi:MAG: hypothetical protein OEZ04_08380, partial [Nitrospinota bacterium]|nr:hypothetical protein [Nitrospinota bacterium]
VPSSLKPGDWTDEQLGSRSVNKGHLTFTYQYLDWMDLPWPPNDTILVAFFTQSENYQNLDSWQIVLIRYALDGNVMTRLASQRDDGICEGQVTRDCKKVDDKYDTPLYQVGSTYKFDCTWDTTIPSLWGEQGPGIVDGRIECNIYDGETLVNTSWVPTSGRYALFDTFLVGGRISQVVGKPDAILYSTLTNVRLTVFND